MDSPQRSFLPGKQRDEKLPRSFPHWIWGILLGCGVVIFLFTFHYDAPGAGPSHTECDFFCRSDVLMWVQRSGLYNSSKSFVDMPLLVDPAVAEEAFQSLLPSPTLTQLSAFMNKYFNATGSDVSPWTPTDFVPQPLFLASIRDPKLRAFATNVTALWAHLGKTAAVDAYVNPIRHSLLPPTVDTMIVAGGRFREMYYWDSYWMVKGLIVCEMHATAKAIVNNLLGFVDSFGFVPNGNRQYYLNRSQPPLLTQMVAMLYNSTAELDWLIGHALPLLDAEYQWWMILGEHAMTVIDPDDPQREYVLNRYYTTADGPRPESYREDEATGNEAVAANSATDINSVYAELAAGAETGWDYSSRWFGDRATLPTIDTRSVIPTDLNAILYKNERTLSWFHRLAASAVSDPDAQAWHASVADTYAGAALARQQAMHTLLWMPDRAQWGDLNLVNSSLTHLEGVVSNFIPLWANVYPDDTDRDSIVDAFYASGLYQSGGVCTSLVNTGQQWDYPNAWPPLQHMLIDGFEQLQTPKGKALSFDIAQRWISANLIAFNRTATAAGGTGFMYEKYDCTILGAAGGGGEYSIQTGFGWTNGVALDLLHRFGDRLTAP